MRRLPPLPLAALALAALLLPCGPARGEMRAVLVGINDYDHPTLRRPKLQYAVGDAAALAETLTADGYRVTLLTDDTARDPARKPTGDNVRAAVRSTLKDARRGDTVLVALAGHGVQFGHDAFFCPSDARPFADETATLVNLSDVIGEMDKSFAAVKVLLVDACRNDPTPGRGRGIDGDTVASLPQGVLALFSCSPGQHSFESDGLRHGVFFHYVLEGLRGRAAGETGKVTWGRLAEYVAGEVPDKVHALFPEHKPDQFPNEKVNWNGPSPVLVTLKRPESEKVEPFTNTVGMKLVPIPAGEFDMGSPEVEAGHEKLETLHHVKLTKGFFMGTTPVTQGQWKAVVGTTIRQQAEKGTFGWHDLYGEGDAFPMYYVSWEEAVDFCRKLGEKEHRHYRLPTEAEWEYACRGGDPRRGGARTAFFFGDDERRLGDYGWYFDNSDLSAHEVGTRKSNLLGLHDMHGNVWQWCSDAVGAYPVSDAVDPLGPDAATNADASRVLRGGAWNCRAVCCRSAYRGNYPSDYRFHILGFRVVLDSH